MCRAPGMPRERPRPRDAVWGAGLIVTIAIGLVAAVLLVGLATPTAGSAPGERSATSGLELAGAFYAEQAAWISGSEPPASPVTTEDFVVHEPGQPDRDLRAWQGRLGQFGVAAPGLWVVPEMVVPGDGRVMVQVRVEAPPRRVHGIALDEEPVVLSALETLVLVDGKVAAYTPGSYFADLPQASPPVPFAPGPEPGQTAMLAIRLAPGTALERAIGRGPTLLMVEAGRVEVGTTGITAVLRSAGGWQPADLARSATGLVSGDGVVMAADLPQTVRNPFGTPASLLVVTQFPQRLLTPAAGNLHPLGTISFVSLAKTRPLDQPRVVDGGAEVTVLATDLSPAVPADCAVSISVTHALLRPGGALPAHRVDGTELVAVRTGRVVVGHDPSGEVTVLADAFLGMDGTDGSMAEIRNSGDAPLALVDTVIEPTGVAGCA